MAWKSVVTNAGLALLSQFAAGGHTLYVDGATVGSGVIPEANMRVATAVSSPKALVSIVEKTVIKDNVGNNAGVKFKVQVGPASASIGAYTAHQIGLFGALDDGESTLLALAQDADTGVGVPLASEAPQFAFALFLTIAVSNTDGIVVSVDETAYITIGTLTSALALKVDKTAVANNLTTETEGKVLDARQGKALADALALKANIANVYTKSETDNLLNQKADAGDVYSKDETDDLLDDKADKSSTYTKGEVDTALTAKANVSDVYTQAQIAVLLTGKADCSDSLDLTATAVGWSDTEPSTQVINAVGVTADNNILVGGGSLTAQQLEAMISAQIMCTAQANGTITLTAYGEKPTIDLPIAVIILG